jgi:DNA-binding winged helix-turn-helix (wHTH) protein/tetratricopeptide (TPR) repeat protein
MPLPNLGYEFGPFRVDRIRGRVLRHGTPIPLAPKAFELLVVFVQQANRVISKAELMAALWPDTFVEDANLTQHVFTLRKALGLQPNGKPYIETIPRHGYSFEAVVRETAEPDAHDGPGQGAPPAREPRSPSSTEAVGGERKQATVLHCGVANAASLAERLGPQEMLHGLKRITALAEEDIGRFGGLMRQREPDSFVALFGARVVHEDDARRATLAALSLQRRLSAIGSPEVTDEERPVVRMGIHTGPVVVSRRESEHGVEYSAVGDTMRIADLVQQLAEPGTILVSDATRRRVEGYVQLEATGTQAAGLDAFRVGDALPTTKAKLTGRSRTLARFVGRDREIGLLDNRAAQAVAGRGQVVSMVGEPGMGKSRLVHEFAQGLLSGGSVTLLEGRCVSYGSTVPYSPLADLIRTHCGVTDSDTPDAIRSAVERAVHDGGLASDLSPWLLRLIGAEEAGTPESVSPEATKARTFDALRTLFLHASTQQPLVIVIEDVHWIDRTSEEFLASLVERLVAAQVMLVTTYRPGYRAPWIDRSYATQITLTSLASSDSAAVVDSIDTEGRVSDASSAAILEKAEGNPFFLEELTRSALEHGPQNEGVPDTIQGVIMARLDRLPDSAKQLLQTASVIGREVSSRLLERLRPATDFDAELKELCRLEFLYERFGGDEPIFVFKHALTQDVAYDSLLARHRRDLHLETARALEELHRERLNEITATLAYHYTRTDLVEEAVSWLIRAAEQAAQAYANAEAISHLDLARRRIERLREGPVRDRLTIDVALRHAHSLYFLGQFRQSVEVLLPHEARVARLGEPALVAAFSFWLAHMSSRLGDQRRTREYAERAIAAATEAADDQLRGKAHGVLCLEGHWSGNTADGIANGRIAIDLLGRHREQRWWLGMAHFYMAMNHLITADFDAALAEATRADLVGKEISDPRLQTYSGYTTAWIEVTRGRNDRALEVASRSRDQAPDRVSRAYATMLVGFALLEQGSSDHARELLQPVSQELEAFGFPQWQGFATMLLAESYRRVGQIEPATDAIERALSVMTRAGYGYGIGFAQRVQGRIAQDCGDAVTAHARFSEALTTFERIGAPFEAARTREEMG